MIKLAMNGASGRMGTRILDIASKTSGVQIVGAFEHAKNSDIGKEAAGIRITALNAAALKGADVVIDFSSPEGTDQCLSAAIENNVAVVIGTTGIPASGVSKIEDAAKKIPVIFSPNMSIGANFIFEIARIAAAKLNPGYDIEIIEAHHRMKKDAPSGTAKKIAEVIAEEKGWDLKKAARYGREGQTGERTADEIGIHVVRGGDIIGEHTIVFAGPGETIELKHVALSRDAFAKGAVVAAQFLAKKPKGLYTMKDVLA
jgi:4-hydroxy-tetrahydrodipicolinate reductase